MFSKTLIELYTEYTNGNKDVLNDIISLRPHYSKKKHKFLTNEIQTHCNDIDMIVKKTFKDFKYRYPRYKYNMYSNNKQFRGVLNDIYTEFFYAFISLADSNVKVNSQEQLCSILKKKTTELVRMSLIHDDFTFDINQPNNQDDDNSCSIIDEVTYKKWFKEKYSIHKGSFLYEIKELHRIQNSIQDIGDVFPPDAKTQKKLIEILKYSEAFAYENNNMKLKKMSDIAYLVRSDKQKEKLTDERLIQSMNQIYSTLIKCVIGYVPCSRKEYHKTFYNVCNIHKMLSDVTDKSIFNACRNNTTADKNYTKSYLMLTEQIGRTVQNLISQGFSPDPDIITDICLYDCDPEYWNFTESSKDGYRLYFYGKSTEKDVYTLRRSRTTVFNTLPECYIIGNCVIYADKEKKALYYLQKENRLFSVIKRSNKYIGHTISYNTIFGLL